MQSETGGNYALVLAAGQGARLGGKQPKQYLRIGGRPMLAWSVSTLLCHPRIAGVAVVIAREHRDLHDQACLGLDLLPAVLGGTERQDSVRLGLEALKNQEPERVLIHDAARPFVSHRVIDRVLGGLDTAPAVLPALPVVDTLKKVSGGLVEKTVDRSRLSIRARIANGCRGRTG